MAIKALVILANGCEEIEAVTPYDLLSRAGISVTLATVHSPPSLSVSGAHGLHLTADTHFEAIMEQNFDIVILPGGLHAAENFRDSPLLINFIQKMYDHGKITAAICATPALAFVYHQLFSAATMTGYPETWPLFKDDKLSKDRVYYDEDHRLLTSQSPGTAIEFSLKIIELLCGSETAAKIAKQLVLPSWVYDYQN